MAFVNAFVSDDDIQRYGLNGIWDLYYPGRKGAHYNGQRPAWTVDKERNIFLLPIGEVAREMEEATKQRKLLWWNGAHVIAVIASATGSIVKVTDFPFRKIWELVSVHLPTGFDVPRDEVLHVLKEAVTTYGHMGIYQQIPNSVIEFKF